MVMGYCRLMLQDTASAREAFERAYALDPERAETQYFLGLSEERGNNPPEAERWYGFALQNGFEPREELREKLASLALRRGSPEEAAEHYRAALFPEDEEEQRRGDPLKRGRLYHALVSLLLEHLQDISQAEEVTQRARDEVGDTSLVLDLLGSIALTRHDLNQAATFLEVAVRQDASFAPAWYHKGLLAEEAKDRAEALRSYREAYMLSQLSDPALATQAAERHNALVQESL